jgi:hypothetical protein
VSLHITDEVVWQETGDAVSLYHTATGDFSSLNESAAKIWVLVADGDDRETIIRKLSLLYAARTDAASQRIRSDVDTFLDAMVSGGLLAESAA